MSNANLRLNGADIKLKVISESQRKKSYYCYALLLHTKHLIIFIWLKVIELSNQTILNKFSSVWQFRQVLLITSKENKNYSKFLRSETKTVTTHTSGSLPRSPNNEEKRTLEHCYLNWTIAI